MSTILHLRSGLPLPWLEHHHQENPASPLLPLLLLPGDGGEGVEVEAAFLIACSPLLRRTLSTFCSCSSTTVMLPSATSAALLHLAQMLSHGSVTVASDTLTDLGALLALLEVDIGRSTGVKRKADHTADGQQDKVPKVPESSQKVRSPPPPQFRSSTPVRTKPEPTCDPIPQLPSTSREAFYRQDTTDSKDILPISSLPAPPLLISIPFQRLASKTVQKIKAVTASQVLSPTRPITCFFCGLSLPAGTDQFQHQEVSDLDLEHNSLEPQSVSGVQCQGKYGSSSD